jgi:hypothetical protein
VWHTDSWATRLQEHACIHPCLVLGLEVNGVDSPRHILHVEYRHSVPATLLGAYQQVLVYHIVEILDKHRFSTDGKLTLRSLIVGGRSYGQCAEPAVLGLLMLYCNVIRMQMAALSGCQPSESALLPLGSRAVSTVQQEIGLGIYVLMNYVGKLNPHHL